MIFLFKFLLKSVLKLSFFRLGVEIRFGVAICVAGVRNSFVLCNSVSADRSGMAVSVFLAAAAACVILLCFAAESRKSYCNGRVKVANGALATYFSSCWR